MEYGVAIARRGWLEKKDVLNAMDYPALLKVLKK
jgi:histidinol phosphatase-like PHP family hydrolase